MMRGATENIFSREQIMKDKALIDELEALEEIIDWLEEKERSDLKEAIENEPVDRDEVEEWLRLVRGSDKVAAH